MAAPAPKTAPTIAAAPNAAPVAEGTPAPGTSPAATTEPKAKVKRPPIKRVPHPALKPDDKGNPTVKLTSWPEDWSFVKHKSLTADDFETEAHFFNAQAEQHEKKAAEFRQRAKDSALLGNSDDRKKVKKVRDIIGQLAELTASLSGKGVNITDMIAGLQEMLSKGAAQAPATPAAEGEAKAS